MKITIQHEGKTILDCETNLACCVVEEGDGFRCIASVDERTSEDAALMALALDSLRETILAEPSIQAAYKTIQRERKIYRGNGRSIERK